MNLQQVRAVLSLYLSLLSLGPICPLCRWRADMPAVQEVRRNFAINYPGMEGQNFGIYGFQTGGTPRGLMRPPAPHYPGFIINQITLQYEYVAIPASTLTVCIMAERGIKLSILKICMVLQRCIIIMHIGRDFLNYVDKM